MKTEETLKKETQELYDKLMEKFGNDRGRNNTKKFPLKDGKNIRIYTVAEFVIYTLNSMTTAREKTVETCKKIVNLEVEDSEFLVKFYENIKTTRNIRNRRIKKREKNKLEDLIAEEVKSQGLINVISNLENILDSLKNERNLIQDRTRELDLQIETLTKEREQQLNLLCGGNVEEKKIRKKNPTGNREKIIELFKRGLTAIEIKKLGFTGSLVYTIKKELEI